MFREKPHRENEIHPLAEEKKDANLAADENKNEFKKFLREYPWIPSILALTPIGFYLFFVIAAIVFNQFPNPGYTADKNPILEPLKLFEEIYGFLTILVGISGTTLLLYSHPKELAKASVSLLEWPLVAIYGTIYWLTHELKGKSFSNKEDFQKWMKHLFLGWWIVYQNPKYLSEKISPPS